MSERDAEGIGQLNAVLRIVDKYDHAIGCCLYDDCFEAGTLTVEIDAMHGLVEYPICPGHARKLQNDR